MTTAVAQPAPVPVRRNRTLVHALADFLLDVRAVLVVAAALISGTLLWCLRQPGNALLSYADVPTHLNLARRVHDDLHPGLGQLGDYWLPLAHVIELPFVWNDKLWHTGLAGAFPSMGCYLLSTWCIYQLAMLMTGQRVPAVIASLAFATNPNVLYLHVLAMFEPAIIASVLLATYLLARWLQGGGYGTLVFASLAVCVATTSRYETWGFAVASALVVAIALIQRRERLGSHLFLFMLMAWYGMALWVIWNLALSGDPLYFLHPPFNKGLGQDRLAILTKKHLMRAVAYVAFSVGDNAGPVLAGLGALGLWRYITNFGVQARGLWLYLLAAPAAFDVFYLWYKGTPPILVPQLLPHTSGNIRYGVVSMPLLCLLSAYLAYQPTVRVVGPPALRRLLVPVRRLLPWLWPLAQLCVLAAVLIQPVVLVKRHYVLSYNEANTRGYLADQEVRVQLARWLQAHYDGGLILMSTFKGADRIILESKLPDSDFVHEGSQNTWRCALRVPQKWVRWIILFKGGDGAAALRTTRSVAGGVYFTRRRDAAGGTLYWVFRRNDRPWQPKHPKGCN